MKKKKKVTIQVDKDIYDSIVDICGKGSFSEFYNLAAKSYLNEIKSKN